MNLEPIVIGQGVAIALLFVAVGALTLALRACIGRDDILSDRISFIVANSQAAHEAHYERQITRATVH